MRAAAEPLLTEKVPLRMVKGKNMEGSGVTAAYGERLVMEKYRQIIYSSIFNLQFSIFQSSSTFLGPRTLSLVVRPLLISIFRPSLRPVFTARRS